MYASLEDVKRALRIAEDSIDEARDAQLRASLAAVESRFEPLLRHLTKSGLAVEAYFDIAEDATLRLPSQDATVLKVRVFTPDAIDMRVSMDGTPGYEVTDNGEVILRPGIGVSPLPGASATRYLRHYGRVEIYYESTGVVPRAVTEGIAFLTAGWFTDGPRTLKSVVQEKIGDYSSTLEGIPGTQQWATQRSYVQQGMWMLDPYLRRSRVQVV